MESKRQQLINIFKEADAAGDKDGNVSPGELQRFLKVNLGKTLKDGEVAKMFNGLDTDGDGKITIEEFLYEMMKPDRRTAYSDFFKQADTDKNGILSLEELTAVLKKNGVEEKDIENLKKCFKALDQNKDGKITSDEFLTLV